MADLAVIIVHFESEALLTRCLEALRASTYADFEAWVVDNGSRTGLDWVAPMDRRFHVIAAGNNIGFSAATNRAFQELAPDNRFVLLLNPDVIVVENTLEEVIGTLNGDKGIGAVTCKLLLPNGGIDPACRRAQPNLRSAFSRYMGLQSWPRAARFLGTYNLNQLDPDSPHEIESGTGAFLMLRRCALDESSKPLDERFFLYGEDLDLCRRIRARGFRIVYSPRTSALHIKGSGRVRSPIVTFHFHRAMWLYYRKWGRFRHNPLILAALLSAITGLAFWDFVKNILRRLESPHPSRHSRRHARSVNVGLDR